MAYRSFVTGAAGFIGSNLIDRLLARGDFVTAYDNLSTGQGKFLEKAVGHPNFKFVQGDVLDPVSMANAMAGHDFVFHLAANADVRFGTDHTRRDLEQNTIATYNVLEAMRGHGIRQIAFSSTGSVYGEAPVIPTPETAPFPIQTSLYGASKVAGEGLIAAYCSGFGMRAFIFRFVSILGERYSHGHVFDFYNQLRKDPTKMTVLGNGKQRKSYLYVQDCIDAIFTAIDRADGSVNIFNLGTQEYVEVNDSIDLICQRMNIAPQRHYTGGDRGWIGDNPFIFLDTAKIQSLGWKPKLTIRDGIARTLEYLQANSWLYEARH